MTVAQEELDALKKVLVDPASSAERFDEAVRRLRILKELDEE